uniref:Uncharacterized protein n=1 Tax=Spongospora subterranea TaxID=70186 RepID=A0A0H5R5A2_9EUKA|eukprot:CRZ03319.1 hypothetical protein [Spongospora subterranea]
MLSYIFSWVMTITFLFAITVATGAIRQWLTKSNKVAALTIGFGDLFGDDNRQSLPLKSALIDDDSEEEPESVKPHPETVPMLANSSATVSPLTVSSTNNGNIIPKNIAPVESVPTSEHEMNNNGLNIEKLQEKVGEDIIFQSLVLLCTRSHHLPVEALYDLVRAELTNDSIQAFQADILQSLIETSRNSPYPPSLSKHFSTTTSPDVVHDILNESDEFGEFDDEESLESMPNIKDEIKLHEKLNDCPFPQYNPGSSVHEVISMATKWGPEMNEKYNTLVNKSNQLRLSVLKDICFEESVDIQLAITVNSLLEDVQSELRAMPHPPRISRNDY